MILNYSCENFCSFKNKFNFSMKPGKVTERFTDNVHKINNNLKVSKIAVVVGENAGGKTNFMRSLDFLKFIILDAKYPHSQLCNFNNDDIQKFNISILINKYIYTYYLALNSKAVLEEKLEIRNASQDINKNKIIFDCKTNFNQFSKKETISKELNLSKKFIGEDLNKMIKMNNNVNSTGLIINFLFSLGIEIVQPFMKYINEDLILNLPDDYSYNVYKKLESNERDLFILNQKSFLEIFSLVDSTITSIEINKESPFTDSKIIRKIDNNKDFSIKLSYESAGVKEFFAWAVAIWKIINENKVVFADELDKVLNSILAIKVINYIKNSDHKGQFIFSTHNILHLNTNIFMKDQIFFIRPTCVFSEIFDQSYCKCSKFNG